MGQYREQVERGAAYLDVKHPGWEAGIDFSELDMAEPCQCILGQTFGHFWGYLRTLIGVDESDWGRFAEARSDQIKWATSCGFVGPSSDTEWSELGTEWEVLIKERLNAGITV